MIRALVALVLTLAGLLLAAVVLLLGSPFWLVAALTRTLAARLSPPVLGWRQLFAFDPALGWRAKPNLDCRCVDQWGDVFHVVTDQHGWPGRRGLEECRIVVFGDSHAFGYGVDHAAAFPQLCPEARVKAVGVPGYNLVQELLLMEQLAPRLAGKLVVWLVYVGNDLHESLSPEMSGYRTPFVRRLEGGAAWEIVREHLSPATWRASDSLRSRNWYATLAALHRDTFLAERAYSACAFLLDAGARLSRQAGFSLAVMTVPAPLALAGPEAEGPGWRYRAVMDPELPDRRIRAICDDLGLPFVPLMKRLSLADYKRQDDHWTEDGHRRVAAVLAELPAALAAAPAPAPAAPAAPPAAVPVAG
ncbi:MAG: hypothetical protein ACE147_09460 [Candidatus Methylomirabilales bacterium]